MRFTWRSPSACLHLAPRARERTGCHTEASSTRPIGSDSVGDTCAYRRINCGPDTFFGETETPTTRLIPILDRRIADRPAGEPAITSPKGFRLSLENWKRAVGWRSRIVELGRPTMRVHDLRHTYASLARSAGADMKLLQVTMGHASITVTAHTYADLYDSDLDRVADAMDTLSE